MPESTLQTGRRPARPKPMSKPILATVLAGGSVVAIIIVLITLSLQPAPAALPAHTAVPAVARVVPAGATATAVAHVPATVLQAIGVPTGLQPPIPVTPARAVLLKNGLPRVVFIGAEYCPFCATERWPLVQALSRFGTFSGLTLTHSSSTDVYPLTNSFDFVHSHYASKYLAFTPVELAGNVANARGVYPTLQVPTATERQMLTTLDAAPYTTSPGAIPFLNFANQSLIIGASYNPQILKGLTPAQIAAAMSNPKTQVALGADGTANIMTAELCRLTNQHPGSVCTSPLVKAAATHLK